jgi:hypothetical protein
MTKLILLVVLSASPLFGCGHRDSAANCDFTEVVSEAEINNEVAVVLAPSDSFVDFENSLNSITPQIREIISEGNSKVAVVLADGSPRLVINQVIDTSGSFSDTGRQQDLTSGLSVLRRVASCAVNSEATGFLVTPEINFLGAIQKGESVFTSEESSKHLIIIGNGLQTAGPPFDFKAGLNADEVANDATIAELKSKKALGNLDGVSVHWFGLGQTRSGDQQALDESARTVLVDFWTKIILESGGIPTNVSPGNIGEGVAATGGIPTSVVPFEPAIACIEPITVTSDDGFEFNEDVATFKFEDKAKASAVQIKKKLDSAKCLSAITVTGYVASGGTADGCARVPGFGEDLSLKRATAFKDLLEAVGVKIKITPVAGGLGPVEDCVNGVGDKELMKQNRIAVITERK